MSLAVGIDLGTTNSVISYISKNQEPKCVTFNSGVNTFPSVYYFDGKEEYLGQAALDMEAENPFFVIKSSKRHIGTDHKYESMCDITPEQVASKILESMIKEASAKLGEKITRAVITVPAYFNDSQRKKTVQAGKNAGIEVLRIINEPTAAAVAYGLNQQLDQKILVFDLGGGTFDVSVLSLTSEGVFQVVATMGDTHLGGDDFDLEIIKWIQKQIPKNITLNDDAFSRFKVAAEIAKKALSRANSAFVKLPFIGLNNDENKVYSFSAELTKKEFCELSMPLINKTKKLMDLAMHDSGLKYSELSHVVLVGGSTRMPLIQECLESWTGKVPNISLNPDEAVAIGAAIQANTLINQIDQGILLIDVTPLSLGIEIDNGLLSVLISRNSAIPCEFTEEYTTSEDNQTEIKVSVFQGERPRAIDNFNIGSFYLKNIPKLPRGQAKIDVTFSLDANGILSVTAKEINSDISETIVFEHTNTQDNVSKLLEDAEINFENDKQFEVLMQAKNEAKFLEIQLSELENTNQCLEGELETIQEQKELLTDIKNSDNLEYIYTTIAGAKGIIEAISSRLYQESRKTLKT